MVFTKKIVAGALSFAGVSTVVGAGLGIHSALQDKTISDKLISSGKNLINNKDLFEIAFKQHRDTPEFIQLITSEENVIEKNTTLDKGGVALKKWCDTNLKLALTEENIKRVYDNAGKYCSLPLTKMKEKIEKLGKKMATNWSERITKINNWKTDETLKQDLTTMNPSIPRTSNEQYPKIWENALDHWCNDKVNVSLVHDKDDTIFKKMENYCFVSD